MNTIFEDRPKSDKEINIILVKRDVAIECAKHIPYPKDIKEIYERNTYYEQNAFMCDSEKELDRILAEIKKDNEYVKAHTPLPHK